MSGDAFTSAHAPGELPGTAIEDCVRARVCTVPLRTPSQLRQLQFHCGKPPPAEEPSTRIFIAYPCDACGVRGVRDTAERSSWQHPRKQSVAVDQLMLERARDMQRDQRDQHPGADVMNAEEQAAQTLVVP